MGQEKDRIKNLTAVNNEINTQIDKLNKTYFGLKITVDGFQKTRDEALPAIANLGKNIEANSMKVKKYNDFFQEYEDNRDIYNFISAVNTASSYEKYDYQYADPWNGYKYVTLRHDNTKLT